MPSRAEDLYREIFKLTEAERTAYVENWFITKHQETPYLDFKCSAGEDKDAQTFSRYLSSFGNTEGGLLVWGIDARPQKGTNPGDRAIDEVCGLKPLRDTRQHIQLLKDKMRDLTNEPIVGIEHLAVASSTGTGGYVLTLIPEGKNKPYRAERMTGRPYYQRVGDNSEIISHSLLRSMFFPRIGAKLVFILETYRENNNQIFQISVQNEGQGTASEVYIHCTSDSPFTLLPLQQDNFKVEQKGTYEVNFFSVRSVHPRQKIMLFTGMFQQLGANGFNIFVYMKDQAGTFYTCSLCPPYFVGRRPIRIVPSEPDKFHDPIS